MPYCTSCGSEIPEGQGSSCSMCYGDISHGSDGYYAEWAREQERQEEERIACAAAALTATMVAITS